MIPEEIRKTIVALHARGTALRVIGRMFGISRNTVRDVVKRGDESQPDQSGSCEDHQPLIADEYRRCEGNVVRVQEELKGRGIEMAYSTLTRIVRDMGLREPRKKRAGAYTFAPGEEMQHDTSPHKVIFGGKPLTAQCAGLVLAYSRRLFILYYPRFTRFEAKVFLTEAFRFMDGVCQRIVIDNTSVVVAHGSGPSAEMAPEMDAFARLFGTCFVAHRVRHPDRKARIERPFAYVEKNFLAGRTFHDLSDLNEQALDWCIRVANAKPKRSLGMSPDEAYLMEKPYLRPLPAYIPPVYQTFERVVDLEGFVNVDTNRYSVPERLIGKRLEVHKHWDRIVVFFDRKQVAEHLRVMDKRDTRVIHPGHHSPMLRDRAHQGVSHEETALLGHAEVLDRYVRELRKRSSGRGILKLRRLLNLKRDYPADAFLGAVAKAYAYGLYDLARLEKMIIDHVAGDFFRLSPEEDP
jgi:transposase